MRPVFSNWKQWFQEDELGFWMEYRRTKNVEMRNFLVEQYLPLVKFHAERLAAKLHDKLDVDDLYQAGTLGLMKAVESYEPERKLKFETYASTRIRGAILDSLRANDWVPRQVRKKAKLLDKACEELEAKLGREPTEVEIAEHLNISLEEYYELAREASVVGIFHCTKGDEDSPGQDIEGIADPKSDRPTQRIEKKDLIRAMLAELTEKEKYILQMYYFDGLTMQAIGEILNITESRVSQIHSQMVNRLRRKFRKTAKFLAA